VKGFWGFGEQSWFFADLLGSFSIAKIIPLVPLPCGTPVDRAHGPAPHARSAPLGPRVRPAWGLPQVRAPGRGHLDTLGLAMAVATVRCLEAGQRYLGPDRRARLPPFQLYLSGRRRAMRDSPWSR